MLNLLNRPAPFVSYLLKDHQALSEYWQKIHEENLIEGMWFVIALRWEDGDMRTHYSSYKEIALETALNQVKKGIKARVFECRDSLSRDRLLWEYDSLRNSEPYPYWQPAYKEISLDENQ